jgi:hypothetical protein
MMNLVRQTNRLLWEIWEQTPVFVRVVVFIVILSVIAGMALRLFGFVGGSYSWFSLSNPRADDSWLPMSLAYARVTDGSLGTLRDLFFVENVKFQYPASSLLLYSLFDFIGITPSTETLNVLVWLNILGTSLVVFLLCISYFNKQLQIRPLYKYVIALTFAGSTLFFYPIMITWWLGQIQALLNFAFALACLLWLHNRKVSSGVTMGLICLIKPQFSLFLIWALLRRQKEFATGQAVTMACGLAASLVLYGWGNNIYYWDVLTYISRHGETLWDNTSINGLINGLIRPDQVLTFEANSFPVYNRLIHVLTLSSSLVIIGLALFLNRTSHVGASLMAFMIAGLSFTLASPVAWGHHYGVVMPMLAVTSIEILRQSRGIDMRNMLFTWSVCLILLSNSWFLGEGLANTWLAILLHWRLFAAIALLWQMYLIQAGSGHLPNVDVTPTDDGRQQAQPQFLRSGTEPSHVAF